MFTTILSRSVLFTSAVISYTRLGKGAAMMSGQNRASVTPGAKVSVVQKKDQQTGKLTEGVVKDLLTKSATHPHGIKVRLEDGTVGRVKEILDQKQ